MLAGGFALLAWGSTRSTADLDLIVDDAAKDGLLPLIAAEGFETLVTHIFDPDDPYIGSDAVFGVKESLLAEFRWTEDPEAAKAAGFDGSFHDVEHDFVLAAAR